MGTIADAFSIPELDADPKQGEWLGEERFKRRDDSGFVFREGGCRRVSRSETPPWQILPPIQRGDVGGARDHFIDKLQFGRSVSFDQLITFVR